MILIGQDVLLRASRRNAVLRQWLNIWSAVVENVEWQSLRDGRESYPATDGVKLKTAFVVTVFNVKANDYRLLASIDYDAGTVQVLDVLTHAEYDKNFWKARY